MTTPPIDISGIDEPLPDPAHEDLRVAVLNAIAQVWVLYEQQTARVDALQQRLDAMPYTTVFGPAASVTVTPPPGTVTIT